MPGARIMRGNFSRRSCSTLRNGPTRTARAQHALPERHTRTHGWIDLAPETIPGYHLLVSYQAHIRRRLLCLVFDPSKAIFLPSRYTRTSLQGSYTDVAICTLLILLYRELQQYFHPLCSRRRSVNYCCSCKFWVFFHQSPTTKTPPDIRGYTKTECRRRTHRHFRLQK